MPPVEGNAAHTPEATVESHGGEEESNQCSHNGSEFVSSAFADAAQTIPAAAPQTKRGRVLRLRAI